MSFFKNSINRLSSSAIHGQVKKQHTFGIRFVACCSTILLFLICMPGCLLGHQSDPLAGWHYYSIDKVPMEITEDYKKYIKTLPKEQQEFVGPLLFFKDDTGRHAVKIEIALYGTFKEHVIIYDSDNKRAQVISYNGSRYGD
jgi:hypothetical protein